MAFRRRVKDRNKKAMLPIKDVIEVKVRCGGSMHRIVLHPNGQLAFPNHESIKELEDEDLIAGLGGKECRCAIILKAWRKSDDSPMPPALAQRIKSKRTNDRLWNRYAKDMDYSNIPESINLTGTNGPTCGQMLFDAIVKCLRSRSHKVKTGTGRILEIDNTPADLHYYSYHSCTMFYGGGINLRIDISQPANPNGVDVKFRQIIVTLERNLFDVKMKSLGKFDVNHPRMKLKLEKIQDLFKGNQDVYVSMNEKGMTINFQAMSRDTSQITALALQIKKITKYVQNKKS